MTWDYRDWRERIFASDLPPLARLLALVLNEHMPRAYPSVIRLEERTGMSRRSVIRAVQELESSGWIEVRRERGRANVYALVPVPNRHQCQIGTSVREAPPPVPERHGGSAREAPPPVPERHPKQTRKQDPKREGKPRSRGHARVPLQPAAVVREVARVRTTLDGWEPPAGLEDEALVAGVPREFFRSQLARLRTQPVGGSTGVLEGRETDYVRSLFGRWRTWSESQRRSGRFPGNGERSGESALEAQMRRIAEHRARGES